MKRIFVHASVISLVFVMVLAGVAWADDTTPGYGPGFGSGNCPTGEFVDEDGDGICDNAPRAGMNRAPRERSMIPQQRSHFDRFGNKHMNGTGRMNSHSVGSRFIDADGDGVCDQFVDEDGDGINDNAPHDGTGNRFGRHDRWRVSTP